MSCTLSPTIGCILNCFSSRDIANYGIEMRDGIAEHEMVEDWGAQPNERKDIVGVSAYLCAGVATDVDKRSSIWVIHRS